MQLMLFETVAEKSLVQPTFVYDFPTEVSPLSKQRPDDPDTVERFELYIGRFEVANAFSELNDPAEQRRRFEAQRADRQRGDAEAHAMDEDYVRALEHVEAQPPEHLLERATSGRDRVQRACAAPIRDEAEIDAPTELARAGHQAVLDRMRDGAIEITAPLIDLVVRALYGKGCDDGGTIARRGRIIPALLARLACRRLCSWVAWAISCPSTIASSSSSRSASRPL